MSKQIINITPDPREHLGTELIPKLLREFSIPACVGLIINGMYNIIDRVFVGQGVGVEGIAGMTIGFPIIIVSLALTLLFSVGATVLFGIRLGEKRYDDAEEFLGNGFILMVYSSLIITALCLIFEHPILVALGASKNVLPYASDYIRIILVGNIFASLSLGLNSLMRSAGAPKLSMATQVLGVVINIIFAPLFIFKFNMGIKGAAIATVMAQAASSIWCIIYFRSKKSPYHIKAKYFKVKKKALFSICKLGLSPFSMQVSNSVVQVILMRMLGHYGGDTAISVIGLLFGINTVVIFPIMGISQGMQPIVSYNYGARNLNRILKTYKYSIIASTIYVTAGFIALQLFPREIISIFNSEDQELINMGTHTLRIFSLLFITVGFQIMTSIFFQATNRPTQSIILGLARQLIFLLPAVSILPLFFKFDGIIYSFPVADVLSTILAFILINKEMKIYKRQLRTQEKFIY
jgi:putative MATE family efflux protein